MKQTEFTRVMKLIKGYYPKFTVGEDADTYNAWFESLQELSADDCIRAVKEYANTEKFAPTIADIKERVKAMPHKMVNQNRCPECNGSGRILVEMRTAESRAVYGDMFPQPYCITCPTCRGWVYKTEEELKRK